MNRKLPSVFTGIVLSLALALTARAQAPAAVAAPASDWSFNFTPYLWIAGVEVETTLDRMPPATPPEATRFESKIAGGALLAAQVHYKSVGLWVDFVWLQVDTKSSQPGPAFSAMDLETDFYHSTVALSYRLPTNGIFHVELLAGARYWSVKPEIVAKAGVLPGFAASADESWTTPVIGADLRYDLSPKWSLLTKGTVSVGGGDSEGWEVMGGVAYRFSKMWSGSLGYRFLHEEYARARFTYFTDIQGFILGVGCRF